MRTAAQRVKAAVRQRRAEERQARREAILAAAKLVYSREGFLSTTVEEIAAEARVSVGTIYLYYKSKEELYVSLLFEVMALFTSELTRILHSRRAPQRKLQEVWDYFYRFHQRFPESYRIFFLFREKGFVAAVEPSTRNKLNQAAGNNFALGAAIVKQGMDAGVYRRGNPREIVDILWSSFMGLVHLSETRENLGLPLSTLKGLHRRTFALLEGGLVSRQSKARKTQTEEIG